MLLSTSQRQAMLPVATQTPDAPRSRCGTTSGLVPRPCRSFSDRPHQSSYESGPSMAPELMGTGRDRHRSSARWDLSAGNQNGSTGRSMESWIVWRQSLGLRMRAILVERPRSWVTHSPTTHGHGGPWIVRNTSDESSHCNESLLSISHCPSSLPGHRWHDSDDAGVRPCSHDAGAAHPGKR